MPEALRQTFFCEKCNKDLKIPKNYIGKSEAIEKARAKHEHKEHALILGIKFKIYPKRDDLKKLNDYFDEYAKAVIFAARVVDRLKNPFLFIGKKNNENSKKKWIFPFDKCDFCEEKTEITHRTKQGKHICNSCYLLEFGENGVRKKIYSAKGRKVEPELNIFNATKALSGTHYNYSIREAFQLLDALKKQRQKRVKRLFRERIRLRQFEEMLEQEDKRYELPKRDRQREKRFIHVNQKYRASELRGYTLNNIRRRIKVLRRNIERESRSLSKKSPVIFKGNRIMLSPSIKFDDKNNKVKLTLSEGLPKEYTFSGLNVANEHGKKFFAEKLKLIKENKPKYAYLLRKQVNVDKKEPVYDYFLQYSVEFSPNAKEKYLGVLGIDRGINTLACVAFLEKEGKKPSFVKFFSGKEILDFKNQRRKQIYFLKGVHNKYRKQQKIRMIEPRIDQLLHNVSRQIILIAKEKNAAISLEQLEKPQKSRFRQSRKVRYKLSQFNFKTLSNYIDYKARKEGIKIAYVPPEMTSQTCAHCAMKGDVHSNTQRPYKNTSSLFKCNKCGIELNADYNAAFNIAQKGLKVLTSL